MLKDDGTIIHFNAPKVQTVPGGNPFIISGKAQEKCEFKYLYIQQYLIAENLKTID